MLNLRSIYFNTMENFINFIQVVIAVSVIYVWTFRFDNVVKDFNEFGLSDLTRNLVGATKIALSTLLLAGIWYPSLVLIPALLIGFFMIAAQYFHFKIKNSFVKHLPSLLLLLLCALVALGTI